MVNLFCQGQSKIWHIIDKVVHPIAMTLENLDAEVLLLPKQSQVTLLARMLERLGQSNEIDQEVASVWVEEAELRDSSACTKGDSSACTKGDRTMENDENAGTPAEQIFQRVRTSLQ
jgi:hypothetical protein